MYTIKEQFPSVRRSTVTLARTGASLTRVSGELHFDQDLRLMIRVRVLYHRLPAIIDGDGYEVWRVAEKLYWYDSQPHLNDPALQSVHPHDKHILPDIKLNRIRAPEMSFTKPNLPALIQEIEAITIK